MWWVSTNLRRELNRHTVIQAFAATGLPYENNAGDLSCIAPLISHCLLNASTID
jgi:hypothetical protein